MTAQRLSCSSASTSSCCSRSRSRSAPTWRASTRASRRVLDRVLRPLERLIYRLCGVEPRRRDGLEALRASRCCSFNVARASSSSTRCSGCRACCRSTRRTSAAVTPDSSFNTAVSFATNTNWQGYGGETTMSYLTQMLGLDGAELRLGGRRHGGAGRADPRHSRGARRATIGNFWVDLTRSTLYILLPLVARARAARWSRRAWCRPSPPTRPVPLRRQPSAADGRARTTGPVTEQVAADGPGGVADRHQAARHQRRRLLQRQLGASVREPDAALELPRDARDPADLRRRSATRSARWSATRRQGWAVLAAMTVDLRRVPRALRRGPSRRGNPLLARLGVDSAPAPLQAGGNMEGKEVRFGIANSALWATATTAASNGSVNSMHDSFTPLGGLVPMLLMQLGEVDLRRRRLRPLRHARLRHRRGVRRRADGRAHAGVPRQEDRGLRDEDGRRSSILIPPLVGARSARRSPW